MNIRESVVAVARTWLNTRWHHHQSCKGIGCDCIGLVSGVGRELGFPEAVAFQRDPRFRGYSRSPEPKMLRAACAEYLDPVEQEQPGDILLMQHEKQPQPHHFGILSGPDYMIHAYAQARRVVENRIDETWRARVVCAFKFRGVS